MIAPNAATNHVLNYMIWMGSTEDLLLWSEHIVRVLIEFLPIRNKEMDIKIKQTRDHNKLIG